MAPASDMRDTGYHFGQELISAEQVWEYMNQADQAGELIGCMTPGGDDSQVTDGINQGHAFTVVKVRLQVTCTHTPFEAYN